MSDPGRAALLAAARFTVRAGLAGIWVRGRLPAGPVIWAANHHSWWDPFIAFELLTQAQQPWVLVMDQGNLDRYRLARRLGAIGTDEPRAGLAAVRGGAVLVLYPEAALQPAGPLGVLASGAAWFAQRAPAQLKSAAIRVVIRGQQYPEVYAVLQDVAVTGALVAVTQRLHDQLSCDLATLDQLNARSDPRRPLPGFCQVMRGRRSWDQRVDALRGGLPWRPR